MKSHEKTNNALAGNSKPSNPPKPSPVKPEPENTVSALTLFDILVFSNSL